MFVVGKLGRDPVDNVLALYAQGSTSAPVTLGLCSRDRSSLGLVGQSVQSNQDTLGLLRDLVFKNKVETD